MLLDPVTQKTTQLVQTILERNAEPRSIRPSDSLTDAGVSSLDMVNLMLALEAEFDIFIPADCVNPGNFRTVASISGMVERVRRESAAVPLSR